MRSDTRYAASICLFRLSHYQREGKKLIMRKNGDEDA